MSTHTKPLIFQHTPTYPNMPQHTPNAKAKKKKNKQTIIDFQN